VRLKVSGADSAPAPEGRLTVAQPFSGCIAHFCNQALVLGGAIVLALASASAAPFGLEISRHPTNVTVSPIPDAGALFLYQASDLISLREGPSVLFETNTPLADGLSVPLGTALSQTNQAFVFAAHWPGRSVDEFGDPEYMAEEPAPAAVLFTFGLPSNLVAGQSYPVDFLVTDPAGRLLEITGPAELVVVRRADGSANPQAQATPATLELADGYAQALVGAGPASQLSGCTLGLRPTSTGALLVPVFDLGPTPVTLPAAGTAIPALEALRAAAADSDNSWSPPSAPGVDYQVSGTYGEWRGQDNADAHDGLDLALAAGAPVVASRGGVVSFEGTGPAGSVYLVLDHGDGWFSRYRNLDAGAVAVSPGQIVSRGGMLAGGLFAAANGVWPLHFEIRSGDGQAQWGVSAPGASQDPLQTSGVFAVAPGASPPVFEEVRITPVPPGSQAFTEGQAAASGGASGTPLYVFARLLEPESASGGSHRLGLQAMSFQAEGMDQPVEIRPMDSTAVAALLPPGGGTPAGFAKYGPLHAAAPDPLNWYEYWWTWDTAAYAADPRGPRAFVLHGQTYGGMTATNAFSFGPEIQGNVWQPLGGGRFQVTLLAHLGADDGATNLLQPDQYRLEVLHADLTPIPGVVWSGLQAGDVTQVFSNQLETAVFSFQLPPAESATNLVLRATSLLAPDIQHEVKQSVGSLPCQSAAAPALVDIPAGTFLMGSPPSEPEREVWEGPQTMVTLTNSFKMAQCEITQGQWMALMTNNPSYFNTGNTNLPVEQVTWEDATNYCWQLTLQERQSGCLPAGWAYRLPTEAEWEYACRAGSTNAFGYGPDLLSGMANFDGHYEYDSSVGTIFNTNGVCLNQTVPVGQYAPNAWGLYDMQGNTWEWCLDGWSYNLPGGSVTNLLSPASGLPHTIRGGGWYNEARQCRAACRLPCDANYGNQELGFRVVLAPQ
jgi:formylglycine-generating enzyme required for sulfatase activity/murein DD-endopeptidase MepM/ murein hydrolase activator NlpD